MGRNRTEMVGNYHLLFDLSSYLQIHYSLHFQGWIMNSSREEGDVNPFEVRQFVLQLRTKIGWIFLPSPHVHVSVSGDDCNKCKPVSIDPAVICRGIL